MGLFKNRNKRTDCAIVQFYEGNLPGFLYNSVCQVQLTDDNVIMSQTNPPVEVRLDRSRITSIDVFMSESQYMLKHKGTAMVENPLEAIAKHYFVINYLDKNGEQIHFDVYCAAKVSKNMMMVKGKISKDQQARNYEI